MSTRRSFIAGGIAAGIVTMTFSKQIPAQASGQTGTTFRTLTRQEAAALNVLGEALVTGSAKHGLADYVDFQLSGANCDGMLMIKYLNVTEPFSVFYRNGLRAANALAERRFGQEIAGLKTTQAETLMRALANERLQDWEGPPAPLFYFVIKADAVDVAYGTPAGFKSLGVPYMAHIAPPTPWGE